MVFDRLIRNLNPFQVHGDGKEHVSEAETLPRETTIPDEPDSDPARRDSASDILDDAGAPADASPGAWLRSAAGQAPTSRPAPAVIELKDAPDLTGIDVKLATIPLAKSSPIGGGAKVPGASGSSSAGGSGKAAGGTGRERDAGNGSDPPDDPTIKAGIDQVLDQDQNATVKSDGAAAIGVDQNQDASQTAAIVLQLSGHPGDTKLDAGIQQLVNMDQDAVVHVSGPGSVALDVVQDAQVDQTAVIRIGVDAAPPVEAGSAVPKRIDVDVDQQASIDQDVDVMVSGYAGPVVVRLKTEQDADLDQEIELDLDADGGSGFLLNLAQWIRLTQETEIDIDIADEAGIMYLDIIVRDQAKLDQGTTAMLRPGTDGKLAAFIDQDVDLSQITDLDVRIEDEVDKTYDVQVLVDVRQDVDIDQDADIELVDVGEESALDVDADQVVQIDQDILIRVEFGVA